MVVVATRNVRLPISLLVRGTPRAGKLDERRLRIRQGRYGVRREWKRGLEDEGMPL